MSRLRTTGNSRTRSRLADLAASAPAFNPVTDIGWKHLYYAGGPVFQALGLSNGADMSSTNWPDEIATNAADLTAGGGTYRSADSNLNSKPSVEWASPTPGKRHSTTVAAGAQQSLPFTVVMVLHYSGGPVGTYFCDGANEGSSGNRVLFRVTSTGTIWSLYMGTDRTASGASTGIKAARIYATSGNDTLTINGSTIISGVNAGDVSWQGVSLSETGTVPAGRVGLYGVYPGDITADGNWSAFQSWVSSTYGVSIS